MTQKLTFVFENEKVYAMSGQKVVESANTIELLEEKLADIHGFGEGPIHPDEGFADGGTRYAPEELEQGQPAETQQPCPDCGYLLTPQDQACPQCGAPVVGAPNPWDGHVPDDHGPPDSDIHDVERGHSPWDMNASVETPNGIRGKVLGKHRDLWGDSVTIRLENGRIVQLPVSNDLKVTAATEEKTAETSPIDQLEKILTASVDGTRESLSARHTELTRVKGGATGLLRQGAAHVDAERLHGIVVEADAELREIKEAIDHIDQAEPFIPTAPFEPRAVEQESIGGNDGTWLDDVTNEMIAEAESTDYNTLMDEGPEAFAAEQDSGVLADAGATRSIASKLIRSKTAGASEEVRERYERIWLDRVEQVRRNELTNRQAATRKEAAATEAETDPGPDEALFS